MGEAQKALKMNVNRKRDLTTKFKQQRKESKGESHYLPQCKDTTYAKSLETQMATVEESLQKWTAKLMQLQEIRKSHLVTFQEVVEFMENYLGIRIPSPTFGRWVKEGFSEKFAGRPPTLPGGMEENLAIHALFMDEIGLPISRKLLEGLAAEIAAKTNTKTTFGEGCASDRWFEGWIRRMAETHPELNLSRQRMLKDGNVMEWFNSQNIIWWFQTLKKIALKYGFAKKGVTENFLEWKNAARVVITDESDLNGAKSKTVKEKVITSRSRVEAENGYRRIDPCPCTDEHITIVGGHNLLFEAIPPVIVISSKSSFSQKTIDKIAQGIPNYPDSTAKK